MSAESVVLDDVYPAYAWITQASITLTIAIANGIILKKEIYQRKNTEILFVSIYIKYFPLSCLFSGLLTGIFGTTLYIPGLCYFSLQLFIISMTCQAVSMGFFQLSRLYYCFSRLQTHSKSGYPNYVFYIMFGIGSVGLITTIIASWVIIQVKTCGWDERMEYLTTVSVKYPNEAYFLVGPLFMFLCWDWITFGLYIVKYCAFKNHKSKDENIIQRIKEILGNIIISTAFYEFALFLFMVCMVIITAISFFYFSQVFQNIMIQLFGGLYLISISYAMFIMQQHNHQQYLRFLGVIDYICCCKLNNNDQQKVAVAHNSPTLNKDVTEFETNDTIQIQPIPFNTKSVGTVTYDGDALKD